MKKNIFFFMLLTSLSFLPLMAEETGYTHPVWSYDGEKLLLTKECYEGVYYLDKKSDTLVSIAENGSGYRMNWSYDSSKVAFKMLDSKNGQAPAVFDLFKNSIVLLAPYSKRCGVPFFSTTGRISFSVDRDIYVLDVDHNIVFKTVIEHYSNLCVVSPDGKWVAYNDPKDQIWVVSTESSEKVKLTSDENSYFNPIWSPDSQKLMVSTMGSMLAVINLPGKESYTLEMGENPSWMPDGQSVLYTKKVVSQGEVSNMDIYLADYAGRSVRALTNSSDRMESCCAYNFIAQNLIFYDHKDKSLYKTTSARTWENVSSANLEKVSIKSVTRSCASSSVLSIANLSISVESDRGTKVLSGVPYIHQVYDTPDWYSGHWACGSTSATMALTYYKLLSNWDCTVSSPYSHVSHYGRYICEKYTYNGYTFDKCTTDPNGKAAYGGYGFICQNDWEDTKGHMAEYFQKHGVASSVDWSPKWEELCAEINNGNPLVILNSLTSAGHYILGIGYFTDQHTVVVNDPYGDKNTPGYPSYDGAGAKYDWPGYNNGYKNLNTVHCFIYARK